MIDLHIHSNNSDGTDSVVEILKKAQQLDLEYISITDHDNCDVYDFLKKIDVKKLYTGNIIKGIELKCAYKGRLIDILGYDYNASKMKKMLHKYYPEHGILQEKYLKHFYEACKKMNVKLTPYEELNWNRSRDWATIIIYNDIIKYPENIENCPRSLWESLDSFRYNYLYNENSEFYIDKTKDYPSLEQCIEIIHKCNGKAFVAHMFIYNWVKDKFKFINEIIDNYKIDGVECFYTKFSDKEMNDILELCKNKGKYISGGTDYHGFNKPGINLGNGYGNLEIPSYIVNDWHVHGFLDRIVNLT